MERSGREPAELMTEDQVFIDSLGNAVRGREKMRTSWGRYYVFCPDHWVSQEEVFQNRDKVAVFRSAASGTIADEGRLLPDNRWRTSAAWLAVKASGSPLKQMGLEENGEFMPTIIRFTTFFPDERQSKVPGGPANLKTTLISAAASANQLSILDFCAESEIIVLLWPLRDSHGFCVSGCLRGPNESFASAIYADQESPP